MKHKCVSKYNPGYPTREQALNNPMLLKNTPERWKGIALVCTAMSAFTLSSCSIFNILQGGNVSGAIDVPVYIMSEDEAVSIITDEAALNGVQFDTEIVNKVNVNLPVDIVYDYSSGGYKYSELKTKLTVDGKLEDKNIFFEYISYKDFKSFTNDNNFDEIYLRVEFMDQYLDPAGNQIITGDSDEKVKVFYERIYNDKTSAEAELRREVKEFIEQLKEQGVI